jgi:hypothetical protein
MILEKRGYKLSGEIARKDLILKVSVLFKQGMGNNSIPKAVFDQLMFV